MYKRQTPAFVTSGRGAVAGLLSLLYLLYVRASWPRRDQVPALFVSALGTVPVSYTHLDVYKRQLRHTVLLRGAGPAG